VLKIKSDYSGARDNKTECHKQRGEYYFNSGRYRDAVQDYNEVLSYSPSAYYYCQRGRAYDDLGDYDRAISDYSEAIRLETDNSNKAIYYYNRGLAWHNDGNCHKAIDDYDMSINLNPRYASAYNNRGVCYMKLGRKSDAMKDYKKACELGNSIGCDNYNSNLNDDSWKYHK
jgi:tetratricopeptide (TPR) repeat protein